MGERALAAVKGQDTTLWYYSQWGGSDDVVQDMFSSTSPDEILTNLHWQFLGHGPLESANKIIDTLTTEMFYLISPARIFVCVPLWFGLGLSDSSLLSDSGLLVPISSTDSFKTVQTALHNLKRVLFDAVTEKQLPLRVATQCLKYVCRLLRQQQFQFHCMENLYIRW
ncbi:hypothetical protein ACFQJ7_09120 [Halovenus rubra]|uniref:Uncharacterized protein n=2 Tax=Halovenus rubra TaxID=869890 RepID=A0ACC7E5A3_9EURY|nr:hypothetical protein [Halovenus rubra]